MNKTSARESLNYIGAEKAFLGSECQYSAYLHGISANPGCKEERRLLMIVPWLTMGGSDKFNLELLKQLISRGWDVTIATTFPDAENEWLPLFAQHTSEIFILHRFLHVSQYPEFLRDLISAKQVDVVMISNSEPGYMLLPYLRSCFRHVAFVDYSHIEEIDWKGGGYPCMGIDSQHYLDLNIVASEHLKRWMVGHGAQEERVAVCHINIDPQEWVPDREQRARVRRSLGLDDAVPVVLCAGRICPQKQPRVFAQTVLQLRQRRLPLVSIVAGDGSEMEWLRRFVRKHNLASHVLLLGAVSNQRVRELMTAADVFFLPSRWEGISLAAYEAMSCGLPVVTADVGGQCELVTPECGILITPSDEKTETSWYVEALTSLLIDRNKRSEMGSCARSRVIGNFPIAEMGSRMINLLELARTLNNIAPRSKPDQSEVQSSLRLTAETIRSYHLSMQLASYSSSPDWKVRTAFMLYRLLRPGYRWSIDHGVPGFARLGNKIKDALVAHST